MLIHKIFAVHSRKSGSKLPSTSFEGLRSVIHLVRGCKVMFCQDIAFMFGLRKGTCGNLVGVVYGTEGIGSFPHALIVDVPNYCGPAFYIDEPTWVPVLPRIAFKNSTRSSRKQFPVVAGFAHTVNKVAGCTFTEGTVIHFTSSRRFRPTSQHGLAYVAFTRTDSFAMTAFKNLPPWQEFVDGRKSDMLRMRLSFTDCLEKLHEKTLAKHSDLKTPEEEEAAQKRWHQPHANRREGPIMPCPCCDAQQYVAKYSSKPFAS